MSQLIAIMDGGLDFAVRYPFSAQAKDMLGDMALTDRVVELAVERLKKALQGQSSARMLLHESDKKEEIASFAAARMILGYLRNSYLTGRFAINEAKTAHAWLDKKESDAEAIAQAFGIVTISRNGRMLVALPTYLRYSPRSVDYRITNRRLANGMVEINSRERKRLTEEAVRKHVERIPLVKDPPDIIKAAAQKLVESLPRTENRAAIIKAEDHPPCVDKLLESLRKHENLNHQARYYLATYLMALGTGDDALVQAFADAPDFKEKTTKYQVGQIRKKGYKVPSCATLMTYGLCCAVCRIKSPLGWHMLSRERKDGIKQKEDKDG